MTTSQLPLEWNLVPVLEVNEIVIFPAVVGRLGNHARCPWVRMLSHSAIHANGKVVCARICHASSTLRFFPLWRALKQVSVVSCSETRGQPLPEH